MSSLEDRVVNGQIDKFLRRGLHYTMARANDVYGFNRKIDEPMRNVDNVVENPHYDIHQHIEVSLKEGRERWKREAVEELYRLVKDNGHQ